MTLSPQTTAVLTNTSLEAVLDEMMVAGTGGTVMIVCHAYQQGMLMSLVGGNSAHCDVSGLRLMDKLADVEAKVAEIRRMPEKTEQEQKTKIKKWKELINSVKPETVTGDFTLNEAERKYQNDILPAFLHPLGLPDLATFRRLMTKIQNVRRLRLERIEFRACNLGGDTTTMNFLKGFFGCSKLLAPTVGTFFLGTLSPDALEAAATVLTSDPTGDLWLNPNRGRERGRVLGNARRPGPVPTHTYNGGSWTDPFEDMLRNLPPEGSSRGFWRVDIQNVQLPGSGIQGSTGRRTVTHFMLAVAIREPSAFHYEGRLVTPLTARGAIPWADVQQFVNVLIMPNSGYTQGPFPLAGFWTPGPHYVKQVFPDEVEIEVMANTALPFVLANEPKYLTYIKKV